MKEQRSVSRRDFIRTAAAASGAAMAMRPAELAAQSAAVRKPNIVMICSDQFRADFVGANGSNPSARTPHIDALAARGTNFTNAVTNQPLCSPARSVFLTGMTATKTTVWKLGLEIDHALPTIAKVLKTGGYSTHFFGKWHVSREDEAGTAGKGWVAPGPSRAGFDTWEGANVPELESHPMYGNYWDNDGRNIGYKDIYRPDFVTGRAISFIEEKRKEPWLLFLSQVEPHQQNDVDDFVPPDRYAKSYVDPFVPADLRDLPGNWRSRLPGYYGCVQAIDDSVGRVVKALEDTGQIDNTMIVFFSDHGCTFRTRLGEYKRSPHDAAIRVPMIFAGPGFNNAVRLDQVVSLLDLTPTLIDGASLQVPASIQGKSLKSLAVSAEARSKWDSTAYIQISASMVARAIRTEEWMFCAFDPECKGDVDSVGKKYLDFAMYNVGSDPFQKVNLVGRPEYKEIADGLRAELKRRIVANDEPEPAMVPQRYFV